MAHAGSLAILNSGTRMSAYTPKTNEYAEPGMFAYLMVPTKRIKGQTKMVTSHGHLEPMQVGDSVTLVGDQSGRLLGLHIVYAIVDLTTGVTHWAKGTKHLFPNTYKHYVVK